MTKYEQASGVRWQDRGDHVQGPRRSTQRPRRRVHVALRCRVETWMRRIAGLPFLRVPDWLAIAWVPQAWGTPRSAPKFVLAELPTERRRP